MAQYIPLYYHSYNQPTSVAAILCILLFVICLSMSYLALKYETLNRQGVCNPMFYYGQACRNLMSRQILLNPELVDAKNQFYNNLDQYNPDTQQYSGAKPTITNSEQIIQGISHPALERTMESNNEFIRQNENEINGMSSLLQLISLKYLGNVNNIIQSATNLPTTVQEQLQSIPTELENLKNLVKTSLIDPTYAKYSAPLQKLYKSLTDIPDNSSYSA